MLPDFERADRIGEFWSYPQSCTFAELLIDCEEDRTLRAVLVGMLREGSARDESVSKHEFAEAACLKSCPPPILLEPPAFGHHPTC
jgi:hypothetical protein